ncbi:MAG: hypothetical protein LAO30_25600 [Acidobacteriia bacterium]|nr:hypothetical protein [Terriglobia bacterium]
MIAGDKKTVEPRTESFLDETLKLAREVIDLRTRLANAQREHAALLAQREDALCEGLDVLPRVRELFLEIEPLPAKIASLEQHIQWSIDQGVAELNTENSQTAARQYMKSRDNLRQALERFREAFVSVQRDTKADADLGPSLTGPHNSKIAQIENILGGVHFPRVTYQPLPLPPIDSARVGRGELLAAIDAWIGGLR